MSERVGKKRRARKELLDFRESSWFGALCGAGRIYCRVQRKLDGLPPEPALRYQLVVDFRYWVQMVRPRLANLSAGSFAAHAAALEEWNESEGTISTSP